MHVHKTRRKRCSRRGVLGAERMATRIGRGPTWQVCIRRHVAGVYTAAHPENSGFPVRMRLRSWVRRRAKVVRVVDAFDFGPSINGGGSVPAGAHVQRECGRAMPRPRRHFADLRYPVTPTLAHKLEWTHDGTDFRPSRNGDGAAPACAHVQRECGRAMALQRGHFAGLGYPVTPMLAHMLWRGRSMGQIFDHRETEMGLCQLARTVSESVEERWRDGVGSLLTIGFRSLRCFAHNATCTYAWEVNVTDSRPSRNGDGTVPAAAHSLRECRGAMVRRRKQFAYDTFPLTSMQS